MFTFGTFAICLRCWGTASGWITSLRQRPQSAQSPRRRRRVAWYGRGLGYLVIDSLLDFSTEYMDLDWETFLFTVQIAVPATGRVTLQVGESEQLPHQRTQRDDGESMRGEVHQGRALVVGWLRKCFPTPQSLSKCANDDSTSMNFAKRWLSEKAQASRCFWRFP